MLLLNYYCTVLLHQDMLGFFSCVINFFFLEWSVNLMATWNITIFMVLWFYVASYPGPPFLTFLVELRRGPRDEVRGVKFT